MERKPGVGQFLVRPRDHHEFVGAVDAPVLNPVAGVGAGQGAERHHPCHEAPIRVRFAGPDKLVHLIGLGEVVPRRWWGFAERLDGAAQIGEGITDRNQLGPPLLLP